MTISIRLKEKSNGNCICRHCGKKIKYGEPYIVITLSTIAAPKLHITCWENKNKELTSQLNILNNTV